MDYKCVPVTVPDEVVRGRYFVDNLGNVFTTHGVKDNCPYRKLRPGSCEGYLHVVLACISKKTGARYYKGESIHRLVAYHFIKNTNPEKNIFINHKDGNPSNNVVDNLEWCTPYENIAHARRVLNRACGPKTIYARNVKTGEVFEFDNGELCARILKITHRSITRALNSKLKYRKGYQFSFTKEFPPFTGIPKHLSDRVFYAKDVKTGVVFSLTVSELRRRYGKCKISHIYKVVNGKEKTAYGYYWQDKPFDN